MVLIALIVLFICCLSYYLHRSRRQYFARPIMTAFEQKMFFRLKQAFPEYHVLTQVAFSALITNDDPKIRRHFNRKVTDFVLMNQNFAVIAIIELDDPTHLHKKLEDQHRDDMLQEAGYRVYRFTEIPSIRTLKHTLLHSKILDFVS